jgi:hypothetical protein
VRNIVDHQFLVQFLFISPALLHNDRIVVVGETEEQQERGKELRVPENLDQNSRAFSNGRSEVRRAICSFNTIIRIEANNDETNGDGNTGRKVSQKVQSLWRNVDHVMTALLKMLHFIVELKHTGDETHELVLMTLNIDSGLELFSRRVLHLAANWLDWEEYLDQIVVLYHFYVASVDLEEPISSFIDEVIELVIDIV